MGDLPANRRLVIAPYVSGYGPEMTDMKTLM